MIFPGFRIAADRGLVALRCGLLIYNVERADQPDITQPIGTGPLSTQWRGDLLEGVNVIRGSWADGNPLLAIPNFARNNRPDATSRSPGTESADPAINYAPSSSSTNAPPAQSAPRRPRGFGNVNSTVWIKALR